MTVSEIQKEARQRMDKSVDHLRTELRGIRTGRASTGLIEYVKVDYYGSPTDLRDLAALSTPEPTQILVKPFDPSAKNAIIKAIEGADLGLNPQAEGDAVRVSVPTPSTERRKQLVAQVRKLAEDAKVAIRNERRDANKAIDQLVKDKDNQISEDQGKDAKDDIDSLTKMHTETIDTITTSKVKEVEDV